MSLNTTNNKKTPNECLDSGMKCSVIFMSRDINKIDQKPTKKTDLLTLAKNR